MIYYPIFLNLKRKRVLLFGGGQVALRKAKSLIQSEARLSVISKDFSDAFVRFAKSKKIKLRKGSQIPKQINRYSLIITATSDASFNRSVYQVCSRKGIWMNAVDDPKHSSFIVPSVVRRGNLQIAISTGGASPALAKLLRQKFETELGTNYAKLVQFLRKDRLNIKKNISSVKNRRKYFYRLVKSKLKEVKNNNLVIARKPCL